MSDETHYTLKVSGEANDCAKFGLEQGAYLEFLMFKLFKAVPEAKSYLDENGKSSGNGYDWQHIDETGQGTLRAFSETVPEILFEISEESVYGGDAFQCRHYIKNGKYACVEPQVTVTWPDFDVGILK